MHTAGGWGRVAGFFLLAGMGIAACSSSSSAPNDAGSTAPACTVGAQVSCACVGGGKGAQVCNADGHSYGMCQCGSVDAGTGGHHDAGRDATGGHHDSGHADSGHADSGHPAEASTDAKHPGDSSPGTDAPVAHDAAADAACASAVVFAGEGSMQEGSNWSYEAENGLAAGTAMCQAQGADHVCDYDDLVLAASKGELSAIPTSTTAWLVRTHSVTASATSPKIAVLGQPATVGTTYPVGTGSNCNNWSYSTDHLNDGEYVDFSTGSSTPTFHLDDNPCAIQTFPKDIPCGHNAMPRDVLCCYAKCGPVPTPAPCTCSGSSSCQ